MATFVLVHGAWHGGWAYRDTVELLRQRGHAVFSTTLTGSGERAHLNHHSVTLETHIRDVLGTIEAEELGDVVLVGHSYSGIVITGVADRVPDRIRSLVYVDAFVPEDGQSLNALIERSLPPEAAAMFLKSFYDSARRDACGMMSPIPAALFGVAERNRAWVDRRCVAQSLATFEMPVLLTGAHERIARRMYILANGWDPSPYRYFARQLAGRPGWRVETVESSHDVMIDHPEVLAGLLVEAI
jgi:pimeloyl-ACP methyl ester carboxylesterase